MGARSQAAALSIDLFEAESNGEQLNDHLLFPAHTSKTNKTFTTIRSKLVLACASDVRSNGHRQVHTCNGVDADERR